MPNTHKLTNKVGDFPVFSHISKQTVDKYIYKLIKLLGNLSSVLKIETGKVKYSEKIMIEIFDRIEKRRVYFHVFYRGCKMGELNEGALLCFWIAKLQPFSHPDIDSIKLNAKIAVCIFINSIYSHNDRTNNKEKERKIPDHSIEDLYYSLLYRDISKESLMILAESFVSSKESAVEGLSKT